MRTLAKSVIHQHDKYTYKDASVASVAALLSELLNGIAIVKKMEKITEEMSPEHAIEFSRDVVEEYMRLNILEPASIGTPQQTPNCCI